MKLLQASPIREAFIRVLTRLHLQNRVEGRLKPNPRIAVYGWEHVPNKYVISPLSFNSSDRPLQRMGENGGVREGFVAGNGEVRVNQPDGTVGVVEQVG